LTAFGCHAQIAVRLQGEREVARHGRLATGGEGTRKREREGREGKGGGWLPGRGLGSGAEGRFEKLEWNPSVTRTRSS